MAEVKQGQIRRWFSNSWVSDWDRGKLFMILGHTDHPEAGDPGWRYMQEGAGVPDWHWGSIIEPRSEVVSD